MTNANEPKVWMNGKLINYSEAKTHVRAHTLHYGTGAFEGERAYKTEGGTSVFRLRDHTKRLLSSAGSISLKVPFQQEELERAVLDTLRANNLEEGYIRPIVYLGDVSYHLDLVKNQQAHAKESQSDVNVVIIATPFKYFEVPMKIQVSKWRRIPPECIPVESKLTGPYISSSLAATEAGNIYEVQEALQLDIKGNVAEGPGENFFMVVDGKLVTPPQGYILPESQGTR